MTDHPAPDQAAQLPAPDPPPHPLTEPSPSASLPTRPRPKRRGRGKKKGRIPSRPTTTIHHHHHIGCTFNGAIPSTVPSLPITSEDPNLTRFIAPPVAPPETSLSDIESDVWKRTQEWVDVDPPIEEAPDNDDVDDLVDVVVIPQRDPSEPAFDPIPIVNGRRLEMASKEEIVNGGKTTRRWKDTPVDIVEIACEERRRAMEAHYAANHNCEIPPGLEAGGNPHPPTSCHWSDVRIDDPIVDLVDIVQDDGRWRTEYKVDAAQWEKALPTLVFAFFEHVKNLPGWELCPRDMPTLTASKDFFHDNVALETIGTFSNSLSLGSIHNGIAAVHYQIEDHGQNQEQIYVEFGRSEVDAFYYSEENLNSRGQRGLAKYSVRFNMDSVVRILVDCNVQSLRSRGGSRIYLVVDAPFKLSRSVYNETRSEYERAEGVHRLARGQDISAAAIGDSSTICFEIENQTRLNEILGRLQKATKQFVEFCSLDQLDLIFRFASDPERGVVMKECAYEVTPSSVRNWEIEEIMRSPWMTKTDVHGRRLHPEDIERKVKMTWFILEQVLWHGFSVRNQLLVRRGSWTRFVWRISTLLGSGRYMDHDHEREVIEMLHRVIGEAADPWQWIGLSDLLTLETRRAFPNYAHRHDQDE